MKPSNTKRDVDSPLTTSAMTTAAGPGIAVTGIDLSIAARTRRSPGSLMPGVPASVTSPTV